MQLDTKYVMFYAVIILSSIGISYTVHHASADPVPVILSPPTNLVAKAVSNSNISLNWSAPTNLGGIAITGYFIERSTDGGATWRTLVADTGSSGTSYSDTGLLPSTTYTYRVSAITILLTSKPSNTAAATTLGAPVNLTVVSQDNTGAALPGFFTRLYLNGNTAGSGYTPHTFSLDSGQTYTVEVDIGYGSYIFGHWQDIGSTSYTRTISISSDKAIVAVYNTDPQPPTNLSAAAMTMSQIDVRWSAPVNNGGSPITGYKISRSSDGGSTWSVIVANTGNANTAYSDTGLSPNTAYAYRIFAINAVGLSKASNVASATTPATSAPPSPPTDLSATAASSSQIDIRWSAPVNNGGSPITGYKIERESPVGGGFVTLVSNTAGTSTTYSDIGLAANIQYNYRVSAINAIGTSAPSSSAYATTPPTVPGAPTGLAATAISSSQINLSWNAPANNGGATISGYKIERYANSTWSTIITNTGTTSTAYSDKGLLPSTTYTYRTSAINAAGTGQPSNTASSTTFKAIHPITQSRSGLVVSDSLTNETMTQQQLQSNPRYWIFGGDAPNEHARYDFFKDPKGLHVGAQAPANDTWAGYFAVSPNTSAMLFHSVLTTPVSILPYQFYENGMYIQTSQPFVNYVTCVSVTGSEGTEWAVISTLGNASQANQFNVLYVDLSPNQPLTRDCTIITNGNNYLKVYLDGTMVYNNSTMNLQMPEPLNTYLEPQSSYPGKLLNGTYSDYYVTTSENIQVSNLPGGAARVDLVDSTGKVITNGTVASGSATLDVGRYHFPLVANIKAYDSANTLIASTTSMTNIYGGDAYLSH